MLDLKIGMCSKIVCPRIIVPRNNALALYENRNYIMLKLLLANFVPKNLHKNRTLCELSYEYEVFKIDEDLSAIFFFGFSQLDSNF